MAESGTGGTGGARKRRCVRRKKHRRFRDILAELVTQEVGSEELADRLRAMGIEANMENAMMLSAVLKGASGDITAARFVRDTLEKNEDESEEAEAKMRRSVFALDLAAMSDEELEARAAALAAEAEGRRANGG